MAVTNVNASAEDALTWFPSEEAPARVTKKLTAHVTVPQAFICGFAVGAVAFWLIGVPPAVEPRAAASTDRASAGSSNAVARVAPASVLQEAPPPTARVPVQPPTPAVRPVKRVLPAASGFRGSLVVTSEPSGAHVFLNGRNIGTTPMFLRNQAIGSRAVRVALDGFDPWSSAVRVVAGAETRVQANLRMHVPSPQP